MPRYRSLKSGKFVPEYYAKRHPAWCVEVIGGGMTDSDALLHECNRLAHEVAREALKFRSDLRDTSVKDRKFADMRPLGEALDRYEEVDRRAQKEATA